MWAQRIFMFANGEYIGMRLIGTEVYVGTGKSQYSMDLRGNNGIWTHARVISRLGSVLYGHPFLVRV